MIYDFNKIEKQIIHKQPLYRHYFIQWKYITIYNMIYYAVHNTFHKPHKPKHNINLLNKSIEDINKLSIDECILELPNCIRNKIGIYCIQNYWKEYTLKKSLLPIWYKQYQYIQTMKKHISINNIHILHLECNTLPENKQFILRCQCSYCKQYKQTNT